MRFMINQSLNGTEIAFNVDAVSSPIEIGTVDITIPEVLAISTLLLSVVIGNTFDNAIEACRLIAPEKRVIHLQLRKQNRILFYSIENPYIDAVTQLRVGKHHGYGLKNVERAVNQNNGNFQVEKVDGNFIVQIRLNCEN